MKTSEMTPIATFNKAVDFFFGHNPANPFWALVALYLRKDHSLAIVQNYTGNSDDVIAPVATGIMPEETSTLTIIGNISKRPKIKEIIKLFNEVSSEPTQESNESIFSQKQWDPRFLLEFAQTLIDLEEGWFQTNFNELFDKIIRRIFANDRYDLYIQPAELTNLVGYLMGLNYKRVYNPFCGVASYATAILNRASYIGEEKDKAIAGIAQLRLLAFDIDGEVHNADSIHNDTHCADLVVATPPFGFSVKESNLPPRTDYFTFLLRKIADNNLRGIVVVPTGTNFNSGYPKELREYLVDKDCVDMIIALPYKVLEYTAVATTIYILDPNHQHKGSIKFVDATHCYRTDNSRIILDVDAIIQIIQEPTSKSKLVTLDEVRNCGCNFTPSCYMDVAVDVPKGASLKLISEICSVYENKTELVTPTIGKRLNFGGQGNVNKAKIYTPNDFTDSKIKPGDIAITSPAIVIPLGTPVKAFVVDNRNETLYSPYSTLILIPDESVILPQYLSIQLSEGYIADQVGVGFMRFVPIDFINRLKIVVPSLEEQRAFVNNYQASLVNKLGIEVDQLKTQQANEFERNMHLRKHALKQVLNEVVPASRRIANFISSQDGAFCKDAIIAERSKSTLNEYSQKLFRNVEKIQRLIAALTDDENYPEAKTFDFATFIAVYRRKKITGDKYRLLWFGESHFLGDEPEMPTDVAPGDHREIQAAQLTAHMAPTALETVLDNLIANAVNHGFVDDQRMDYGIKILFTNILVEGTMMLEVRVMNNGAKLPDGMTPDRVFTWGIGSGTGLGSWQVKNIIEHYGGSVEFIQHDDAPDGYNIEYRIVIPMS